MRDEHIRTLNALEHRDTYSGHGGWKRARADFEKRCWLDMGGIQLELHNSRSLQVSPQGPHSPTYNALVPLLFSWPSLARTKMSDREGHSGGGAPTEEDLSLPKATVAKMIAGMSLVILLRPNWHELTLPELLPNDVVCAKETRDLVIECCVGERRQRCPWYIWWTDDFNVEFIHLISSEANEICEADSKKTIAPEHIISALTVWRALSCCLVWNLRDAQRLGFTTFAPEVESVLKDHKQQQKVR